MGKAPMKLKLVNSIRALRNERGIAQEELAKEIEVTRATIIAIEKGNYNPSLELAFRMAKFFEANINDLFWVEDNK